MAQLAEYPHLEAALKQMSEEIGHNYSDSLRRNGHDATTALSTWAADVTKHKIQVETDTIAVIFDLPSYWKYVEEDTRPHWPPEKPIAAWIEVKPVLPSPGRNGKLPTPAQLNFLIRRKIATVGTTGTHELAQALDVSIPFWAQRLAEALAEDLQTIVKQDMSNLFKDVYGA